MARTPGDDILAQLLETFAAEAGEYVRSLTAHLLELEKGAPLADPDRFFAEILRSAHSLKGAAAAVNLDSVRDLAHRLETTFGHLQRGDLEPAAEVFDLLYESLDGIEGLIRAAIGRAGEPADIGSVLERLDALNERSAPSAPTSDVRSRAIDVQSGTSFEGDGTGGRDEPVASGIDETVRLSTAKLDSLMALVGQLLAVRLGTDERLGRMRDLVGELEQWSAEWRRLTPHHRSLRRAIALGSNGSGPLPAGQQLDVLVEELLDVLQDGEERLSSIGHMTSDLERFLEADGRRLAQITDDISDDVRRVRMLPVSTLFDTFPRIVRDLARSQGKEVDFTISGGETEVDRSVLEQLRAPLTHLLRNCIHHGIEEPEERIAARKPSIGKVTLEAFHAGNTLRVEVADDGAGIDADTLKAAAVEKGVISRTEADGLNREESLRLIFHSGFSTSSTITDLSGRGVGLDVVRETVERLNGLLEITSSPGEQTKFSLHLPLSVATSRCALVESGGQIFAIPIATILRAVRVTLSSVVRTEGRDAIDVDGAPVALASLSETLGLPTTTDQEKPYTVLVLGSSERRVAFLVDGLQGVADVVVKNLPAPFKRVRHVAGATILGTGRGVMILNVADLIRSATDRWSPATTVRRTASEEKATSVLIVDDSITTRTLEKNILESAGFSVAVAADGLEAWGRLQSEHFDILVTDLQMPRMDGFDLTAKVREHAGLKNLPVVLVTSLDSRQDKERGMAVGADAYIVKSAFDQERLLETIRRLV
jgi:two-component system, chemotaxis family, sensor kinase CheA